MFLSEVECGTQKWSPKLLRSDLNFAVDREVENLSVYLAFVGADSDSFLANYEEMIKAIELPIVDEIAAVGLPRQYAELQRSVDNVRTLMSSGTPKQVIRAVRSIATLARRTIKTALVGGLYIDQGFVRRYADSAARAACGELRKLENGTELIEKMLEEFETRCEDARNRYAELATTAEPNSLLPPPSQNCGGAANVDATSSN